MTAVSQQRSTAPISMVLGNERPHSSAAEHLATAPIALSDLNEDLDLESLNKYIENASGVDAVNTSNNPFSSYLQQVWNVFIRIGLRFGSRPNRSTPNQGDNPALEVFGFVRNQAMGHAFVIEGGVNTAADLPKIQQYNNHLRNLKASLKRAAAHRNNYPIQRQAIQASINHLSQMQNIVNSVQNQYLKGDLSTDLKSLAHKLFPDVPYDV